MPLTLTDISNTVARLQVLESAVVHAQDAVVILESEPTSGPGRSVLYANPAFFRLSGYSEDEVIGRSLHFLRGPDSNPFTLVQLRESLDLGESFKGELLNYRKDGSPFWVELIVVPAYDKYGTRSHWVMIQRDISDRKRAENERRASEARLAACIRNTPSVAIQWYDRDGRVVLWNPASEDLFGFRSAEAVGKTLDQLIYGPDEAANFYAALQSMAESGQPIGPLESKVRRKDGEQCVILSTLFRLPGIDGAALFACMDVDITARKLAEDESRRNEAMLAEAQSIAHIGSWEFDPKQQAARWSDEQYRIFGVDPATFEPCFDQIWPLIHPDDRDKLLQDKSNQSVGSIPRTTTYRIVRPNGDVRFVHEQIRAEHDAHGQLIRIHGVTHDITERRQAEQQLLQAQKMELIGQMAGGIAHDFNNLLTGIIGNLALTNLLPSDPNRRHVDTALKAASRAADLTKKLLGFARKNQLLVAPILVEDIVNEVVSLITRTFDPRIRVRVELKTHDRAVADATLMSQVLLNLCMNSRDAMPNGGIIRISAQNVSLKSTGTHPHSKPGEYIVLSVEDNGTGMPAEVQTRIFEPFFTTKPVGQGTGLGLAMVHGILTQHQGWVEFSSTFGKGTKFELYIPRVVEPSLRKPLPTQRSLGLSGERKISEITPPPAGSSQQTILLVDDEEIIRELARNILESVGYQILLAEDGEEALKIFRLEYPTIDLVILDMNMPKLSGMDTFHEMMAIDPSVRILLSSGYSADDVSGMDGIQGMLAKPYRPSELISTVRETLKNQAINAVY